jgi:2-oxoglutarate dehydrogenase E2 component (dihydrolipoamide succinyltransferase)
VDQKRIDLIIPKLGLVGVPISASVWLKSVGCAVVEGERLLEIVAGDATIDLPAPASGVLVEQRVGEDEHLIDGQVVGVIAVEN